VTTQTQPQQPAYTASVPLLRFSLNPIYFFTEPFLGCFFSGCLSAFSASENGAERLEKAGFGEERLTFGCAFAGISNPFSG
jgi:hypothetical protein